MSIAHTCIYDTLESCKYARYWYGKPIVSKCKDCNRNPNNYPKTQVGTKDEMKDKISMALKDPVLQQGFEIICKKNAELEKENAELKEKISILLSCKNCPENKGGWICAKEYDDKCLAQKIEFIKELEKENAELQEQCSILADSNVCSEIKEQLTKAKEIIKEMLSILPKENIEGAYEITEEAEQFLKEARTYKHYIKIPFKGESPIYSTKQAAGADIALPKDVVAKAHSIVTWIDLEVGFDIPEGFCIMLQPRSSTSRKWHVLTDTGIIDSDYKLENIHCGLVNVTDEDIIIPKGTRIVQLLILPVYHATNWKCLNNIRDSKKGSGSTGD